MTIPIPEWLTSMETDGTDPVEARCARIKYLLYAASALVKREGKLQDLAERVECTYALLYKLCQPCRDQKITPEMAIKVEHATSGAVTRAMLRPDLYL